MELNDKISKVLTEQLAKINPTAGYTVETRTGFDSFGLNQKPTSSLHFVMKSQAVEDNSEQAQKDMLAALATIDPLKPYVVLESTTNHMERLATELEWFRRQDLASTTSLLGGKPMTTIHHKAPEWFRELPKRSDWNLQHALNVTKEDTGVVKIRIDTPKDVNPGGIVANFNGRMAEIKAMLADRVIKYSPNPDKAAIKAQVEKLEITVTAETRDDSKSVYIYIMSPEQLAATKQPGGISADKIEELSATNPLVALQDGESDKDKTPGRQQPHLKKALARAFLFAGESHIDIFPYIAGKEDMRRAVGKSLAIVKKNNSNNAELVKRIDAFLADPVFIDHEQWNKPIDKQEFIARAPMFNKETGLVNNETSTIGKTYEPGVMHVNVNIPPDKAVQIKEQIAAFVPAPPAPAATSGDLGAALQGLQQAAAAISTAANAITANTQQSATPALPTPANDLEKIAESIVAETKPDCGCKMKAEETAVGAIAGPEALKTLDAAAKNQLASALNGAGAGANVGMAP